jgi:AraC-like DNA-binding protein
MLQVANYNSDEAQDWLVNKFESFRYHDFSSLTEKYIPRPDISVIFHFNNIPFIVEKTYVKLEPFFATPILSKAITVKIEKNVDAFIVNCKPTVFSRLFNIDMSPVSKHDISLPQDIFYPVWKRLASLNSPEDRIGFFTEFINQYQPTPYTPDTIDFLYDAISEKSITEPLKEIMQNCDASARTIQRNLVKRAGVSPKKLARIVRINYLWDKIKNENVVDYQDLIFDGSFFDQSHFIKDFKSITGETPHYFFTRNQELIRMFSGK